MDKTKFKLQIGCFLPESIRELFSNLDSLVYSTISEIRLCAGASVITEYSGIRKFVGARGLSDNPAEGYNVTTDDITKCIGLLTKSSVYAYNRFINEGFLTIPGGHRVGLCGICVTENNKVVSVKNINSLNFRIAHYMAGVADLIFEDIFNAGINNTLVISPPGCGKTTMLKDIIRLFLDVRITGKIIKCVVIDERSELVACDSNGSSVSGVMSVPVIYSCPKDVAIPMAIRSMSPDVIIVDELAGKKDISAVRYASAAGCSIVASTHGTDENNNEIILQNSPDLFKKLIVLSCRHGPGTVEKIMDIDRYA